MYFIPSADALYIKHGKSAYIQAKLTMPVPEQEESALAGYIETCLCLYQVSEKAETGTVKNIVLGSKPMEP